MYRKNPLPVARPVEEFPENPAAGATVRIPGVGLFEAKDDGSWVALDGSTWVAEAAGEVVVRKSVVRVAGSAVLCNRAVHTRCDGVVVALAGTKAIVRETGLVEGFEDLTPGAKLFVGADPGSIVEGPLVAPPVRIIVVGFAPDDASVFVRLFEPKQVG